MCFTFNSKIVNSSRNSFLGLSASGVLRVSEVSLELEEFPQIVGRWSFALAQVAKVLRISEVSLDSN